MVTATGSFISCCKQKQSATNNNLKIDCNFLRTRVNLLLTKKCNFCKFIRKLAKIHFMPTNFFTLTNWGITTVGL